jgi:hypothetical protein|tara:strand:+ start:2873 stop:3793 length:921 start_codon:yes stop_codon:yes gene_type:complete
MNVTENLARWLDENPEYIERFSNFIGTPQEYYDRWNPEWYYHWHENKEHIPYPYIRTSLGSDHLAKWEKFKLNKEPYFKPTIDYYTKNTLTYKLNSHGFRDEEWESKPEVVDVYLGDSHTLGTGILLEDTWPTLVAKKTNFPSVFCGLSGGSIVAHFHILLHILKKFKVRNVFHNPVKKFVSLSWKYNLKHTSGIAEWDRTLQPDRFAEFIELFNPSNTSLLYMLGYQAVKGICEENNINHYYDDMELSHGKIDDRFAENHKFKDEYRLEQSKLWVLARDNFHAGCYRHRVLANSFIEKLGYKLFI